MRPIDADELMQNIRRHCIIPGWCYPLIELEINDAPTIEAVPLDGAYIKQIRWERDIALEQLADIGCELGRDMTDIKEKLEAVPVVHGNRMQDFNNDLIRRTDALNMVHNFFKLKMDSVCVEREEVPMGELDPFLKDNKELSAKIKDIPKFETVPVAHGEWVSDLDEDGKLKSVWRGCSVCGCLNHSTKPNFCPNCGAKMKAV